MSVTFTSVEKINTLKQGIEATTGKSYNNLTEAVQGLKSGYGQGGTTEGGSGQGGTSAGGSAEKIINLSYTLNKDGTYQAINPDYDSSCPSGEWAAKFVFVSDKIYTANELLGHTIRIKEIYVPTEKIEKVRDIEITEGLITSVADGFAIFDQENGFPVLSVITESMAGIDVGLGFLLPSKPGTYLMYVDKLPERQSTVLGSVSVQKAPGKPYFDTSALTNFNYFFVTNRGLEQIETIDTSNAKTLVSMFSDCTNLNSAPLFDTSNVESVSSMFSGCTNLTYIPLYDTRNVVNFGYMLKDCAAISRFPQLDTSKGGYFNEMFSGCRSLTTIPLLDLSKASGVYNIFYGCTALKTLSLIMNTTVPNRLTTQTFQDCAVLENLTINKGWQINIYLHYSNLLTVESLHGMIENLADLTGLQSRYFQIGATNLAKIDEEHINMLNAKNWTYS